MVLHIGMGKANDCRMILEAVCEMNMDIQALTGIAGFLEALLRMKFTYDPADTDEEQPNRAFARKSIVTQSPDQTHT